MAIVTEISRLENAASIIKTKTTELELNKANIDGGGVISSSDKLDVQARAINAIDTLNAPTVTLSGSSQTIQSNKKFVKGNITIPAANVFRTGSDAPTSSTPGNEGDLYLVV